VNPEGNKKSLFSVLCTTLIIVAFVIAWQVLVSNGTLDVFFYSSPTKIISDLVYLFQSGEVYPHLSATLTEAFMGLIYGTIFGIVFAFLFGRFKVLSDVLDPIIIVLYGLPKLAIAPLFILWFGIGITSKIVLSATMVFFQVFFTTYSGYKDVDISLINTLKIFGASEIQIMTKVIFPSCIPWILTGFRTSLSMSIVGAIVGEYMGAYKGLGWIIQYATGALNITRVFSAIIILLVVMVNLDYLLKYVEKKLIKWRPSLD
jgi:NitT/TauT family transport system permease protein